MTVTDPSVEALQHQYGDRVVAVEPGGVEFIPLDERHGRPIQLLWTWTSPNMEFATVAVGILGPLAFGLTFWQSVLAIVLGTAVGAATQGLLSARGPKHGVPQMVLSRSAFGFRGNILPAGINAIVAGIGWFAVNSVSGALALHALIGAIPAVLCLVLVVAAELFLAFFGHNLVQAFERYAFPVLAVIFVVASLIVLGKGNLSAVPQEPGGLGGFLIMLGATYGYAAGWNPYAGDYTRYLPADSSGAKAGFFAALGIFWSCALLETAGAAVVSAGQTALDPSSFTNVLPGWLGALTLLAVVIGAISANALNVYSGSLSFVAAGVPLRSHRARAAVAAGMGIIGFFVAWAALGNSATYEGFLLIISYWVAPWLGVILVDWLLRRGTDIDELLVDRTFRNLAGPIAMGVAMIVSIWLFSNQQKYTGPVPSAVPDVGDITAPVGFLLAALLYFVLVRVVPPSRPIRTEAPPRHDGAVTVDASDLDAWLAVAVEEAKAGLAEGGIPIGAALVGADGTVLGRGRNRRVQDGDPSLHGETAAFKAAGRQRSYRGTTMVTTLSPCWYCSGLVRQFGISRVLIGEAQTFSGGHDWLADNGVEIVVLGDPGCVALMTDFIAANPALWNEDIGEDA